MLLFGFSTSWALPASAAEYDPQKAFEEADKKARAGENVEAARLYQTILANKPRLSRARLELAVAYFRLKELAKAREEAEKVLNDPTTPEKVKINIRNFLANVRAAGPQNQWTPYVSIGYMYDDNVNVGPGSSSFLIGGNVVTVPGIAPKGDHAITAYAGVDHQYMFSKTRKIGKRVVNIIWQSLASYYRVDYDDQGAYDLDVVTFGTGPAFTAIDGFRGQLMLQVDFIDLGHDRFATFIGLNPSITWPFNNKKTELTAELLFQDRNYYRRVDRGRDSDLIVAGVSANHIFANEKWSVQGGLSLLDESSQASQYSNDGFEAYVGANRSFGKKANVYARYTYLDLDYDGRVPGFNRARNEDTDTILVGFNYKLSLGFLDKWQVTGNYQYTDTDSNIKFYSYDREQVEFALERTF